VKQECIFVGQVLLSTYVNNGLLTVHGEYANYKCVCLSLEILCTVALVDAYLIASVVYRRISLPSSNAVKSRFLYTEQFYIWYCYSLLEDYRLQHTQAYYVSVAAGKFSRLRFFYHERLSNPNFPRILSE